MENGENFAEQLGRIAKSLPEALARIIEKRRHERIFRNWAQLKAMAGSSSIQLDISGIISGATYLVSERKGELEVLVRRYTEGVYDSVSEEFVHFIVNPNVSNQPRGCLRGVSNIPEVGHPLRAALRPRFHGAEQIPDGHRQEIAELDRSLSKAMDKRNFSVPAPEVVQSFVKDLEFAQRITS